MRTYFFLLLISFSLLAVTTYAQTLPKQLKAKRTAKPIKIDGLIDEEAWKDAPLATNFIEWRPTFGAVEDSSTRTEVRILFDNTSVYVAGYCHERTRDSVSKELVGRDMVGVNDFLGVIFDTYNDKINAFGFYVTPLGEQYDARYSSTNGEDGSWNAVWDSEAKIVGDGWTFEMRIPYSALRFVSKENQTWGLNMTRRRNKTGQQFMWNPLDPKINGFINQEGEWVGIDRIEAPVRLSLSPYLAAYANHFKSNGKSLTTSVNGGMDVKYGISDAFTLDMTLVPDFGQVRSDNQVLNLSPFEVRFQENRPFFTEGTELFNKGNLFYSRRIGSMPIRYGDAYRSLGKDEYVFKNPTESKLLNATKISGRTKSGLGLGLFNALTKPMYAVIEDSITKGRRGVQTGSLTNYNIMVIDQTLKNNSSISLINTSTVRSSSDYDANVSAALFDFNNKKNTFNWNGKFALSQIITPAHTDKGYSHNLGFGKTGGRWNFQLGQELADEKYNINDMGILYNNNYIDYSLWTGYRWLKPGSWYNSIQVNFNAFYNQLFKRFTGQKVNSMYQSFNTNTNANVQLKNLWWAGVFLGYAPEGNDFYEPRKESYSFRTSLRKQYSAWVETNSAKKYYVSLNYFLAKRSLFNSATHQINFSHRYRFNDKISMRQDLYYSPASNDAGFYDPRDANGNKVVTDDILFARRNRNTIENVFSMKYSFSNRAGVTFRARHYWSKVEQKEVYDLQDDGTLKSTRHAGVPLQHQNFNIFNIDAVYTWQFAPGSFVNIVWKDESSLFNREVQYPYFKNIDKTLAEPQNNNLSIKIIYYLDYLDFKKWKKKEN